MSEAHSIIYSPEALNDLRGIYSYIAFSLKVPGTAEKQVNRIRKEVRSLSSMPQRYALVDCFFSVQKRSKSSCDATCRYVAPSFAFSVHISSTRPMDSRSRSAMETPSSTQRRRNSGVVISRSERFCFF